MPTLILSNVVEKLFRGHCNRFATPERAGKNRSRAGDQLFPGLSEPNYIICTADSGKQGILASSSSTRASVKPPRSLSSSSIHSDEPVSSQLLTMLREHHRFSTVSAISQIAEPLITAVDWVVTDGSPMTQL